MFCAKKVTKLPDLTVLSKTNQVHFSREMNEPSIFKKNTGVIVCYS
jgi:hypothetical protein